MVKTKMLDAVQEEHLAQQEPLAQLELLGPQKQVLKWELLVQAVQDAHRLLAKEATKHF